MSDVFIRPPIHRESIIPKYGLQIGTRGDRWEEEFIKNIDFSTMDDPDDWSYLFRNSKAYDFDLGAMNSKDVVNMDYMFQGTRAGVLQLAGLTIGANTSATNIFSGDFDAIDFTGAKFYSLPANMFEGASIAQGLQLRTLDVSNLTSLAGMFKKAQLVSLDLTGFDTHTITDMHDMFNGAKIPTFIGINTLDYSNVTDVSYMFAYSEIPDIDLSNIDFKVLEDAQYMFYVNNISQAKAVNLSNSKFSSLINANYMFYSYANYNSGDPPTSDRGLTLNLTNMKITSSQLNAYYMFAYLYEPNGLDLSCFEGVKIYDSKYMFYYSILGETDFTMLDFSEAGSWINSGYTAPFYYCCTPIIHLKTGLPYTTSSYSYEPLTWDNRATEVILELTTPPTTAQLYYFINPQYIRYYNTSYLIKNSELYAPVFNQFICEYHSEETLNVTFENTTFHIGNNGVLTYFIQTINGGIIDMRDVVVDGIVSNSNYFFRSYNNSDIPTIIYFPESGMKFTGKLDHFIYNSANNPNYYVTLYNIDRFDMSEIQTASYALCGIKGTYDLRNWGMNNIQSIGYGLIYYCSGSFDLSGWSTSKLIAIASTMINYFVGNLNLSNWDVSNVINISQLAYGFNGHLDIRNWKLRNISALSGINASGNCTVDFDGWEIQSDQNVSNCNLFYAYCNNDTDVVCTIYIPNTLYQPSSYTWNMFSCDEPSEYHAGVSIIDVYTNATNIEDQGWKFYHIYSDAEPYGYRIHLNTTHDNFLEAIGGD